MDHSLNSPPSPRSTPPTAKEKNAVQRAVNGLLDMLAPERATTRASRMPVPVERHRTPTGCVLQAATAALSVSWFPDTTTDGSLGELQIAVWRGVLSRRGSAPQPEAAVVMRELVVRPVAQPTDEFVWRGTDGATYDVTTLAAHCTTLLESQMLADDPTGTAQSTTARRRD
ncbi:MAG: hypothetical protein ABJF01_11530 [bacterium]